MPATAAVSTPPVVRSKNSPGDILVDQIETFCKLKRPRVSDIVTVKEMFYALISKTGLEQKRRISNAIAQNPYIPRQLVLFMALQPIEVATPVLLCSPVLNERDLEAILSRCEKSHAYIIARRHDLTGKLVSQLLTMDDKNRGLKQILKKNESARGRYEASRMTGFSAVATKSAESTVTNHKPEVAASADVPAKQKVKDRNKDLLELARIGKKKRAGKGSSDKNRPAFKPAAFGQRLIALLREDDSDGVANEIHIACGLSRDIIAGYVRDANAGTLASILFLLSVPHYTAARILLLICPKIGRDHSVFVRIMREFSKLDRAAAIAYFRSQDSRFSLPTKRHHIIEAKPMFNALRRNRERRDDTVVRNTRHDIERLRAG